MQPARAALVSTTRDGATIQPPLPSEERREVHGGLSCEIVSDLCPNPFSHDWHVQPSCQRPNRLPPERRAFSPGEPATRANPTVLETFQTYRPRETLSTCTFHSISTCGICSGWAVGELSGSLQHATILPSALDLQGRRYIRRTAEAEDRKLRKDPNWRSLL